jgi:UV DNA damage endonuclease
MFNQNINRVGFACKFEDGVTPNLKTTTITWLDSATRQKAEEKLYNLLKHNLTSLFSQIKKIASLPSNQRMFRISSEVLPAYTHDSWSWFYHQKEVQILLERELSKIGDFARDNDVRLSFHPGQFCVLASDNPQVVENSIWEFEYHCDLIRMMGFGKTFQDFKCNVHIGGKSGPQGIVNSLKRLSAVARNVLTIENDEFKWGLESSLELVKHCALVLDIHHHWIRTGEYIDPQDDRVKKLKESWRGVRPVIHYSVSREGAVQELWPTDVLPDLEILTGEAGLTKTNLRAHSDYYWNAACNTWAYSFSESFDIMLESKTKDLAHKKFCVEVNH